LIIISNIYLMQGATVKGTDFRRANLRQAVMRSTWLDRTDITDADLRGTRLSFILHREGVSFDGARFDHTTEADYSLADMGAHSDEEEQTGRDQAGGHRGRP
jgi:uncharacterized protein YjbI with pentapeptide repeats